MMRPHPTVAALFVATALTIAPALPSSAAPEATSARRSDVTIRLVTHDSFAVSKKVLGDFTRETGVHVEVLPAGDAGAALNQVILTKDHPLGDVLFGVDNTFLSRALSAGIFVPVKLHDSGHVPSRLQLDPRGRAHAIDHGSVCVNYDKAWFADHRIAVPRTLEDLARRRYRDLLVVENPATSSPGLAFVLATIARFGERGWRTYWSRVRKNGVQVVDGWEQAYNGSFSAGEGNGDRPLVVSYASSPAAEVYFAHPHPKTSPIGTVLDTCFDQVEFAGVLKGTTHEHAATELVDFMLSKEFQADIPLQMFVYPVRSDVALPRVFDRFADVPQHPASMDPTTIGRSRERWINEWNDTVLR
jgi:thiamine transport system substrate-binding protein